MDTHSKPPKLMDRVRATLRVKRYSPRTEKTYCYWIRYFIRFHGVRHPRVRHFQSDFGLKSALMA